jgi:hypothetical protein
VVAASASALSLPLSFNTAAASLPKATAGTPTSTNDLFCGTYTPSMGTPSGQSNVDRVTAMAPGNVYPYTSGQTCEDKTSMGSFSMGSDMFTWTISHANVNTVSERGTEHGFFVLASNGRHAGVNGQVTDYDFGSTSDYTCTGGRTVYYSSGHVYDNCGQPGGAGNFNTHGGAQLGQHYRGMYGTIVYQDSNNTSCQPGSMPAMYCFEAILKGQTN